MMLKEDQAPRLGMRRRGMVLVCHGDDQPDQFANWLGPLVVEFERISAIASDFGIALHAKAGSSLMVSTMDFCRELGVDFSSKMWEGSLISGIYHFGWIKEGTIRSVSVFGRKLLRTLVKQVDTTVRSTVIRQLQDIKDLESFIDRTADDRASLRQEISTLKSSLHATNLARDAATAKAKHAAENDTSDIDRACVRLAANLLSGEACRSVAGPLVLWTDGMVYAICSWGGTPIPDGSSPAVLLDGIKRSGRTVVEVREATIIGGWLSGPIYRKGPVDINGWSRVWAHREQRTRGFTVDPPEYVDQVRRIHEFLASASK